MNNIEITLLLLSFIALILAYFLNKIDPNKLTTKHSKE